MGKPSLWLHPNDLNDDVECIFNPNSNVRLYSNPEAMGMQTPALKICCRAKHRFRVMRRSLHSSDKYWSTSDQQCHYEGDNTIVNISEHCAEPIPVLKLMPLLTTSTSNPSASAPFIVASANSSGRKGPRVPAAAVAGPIAAMTLVVLKAATETDAATIYSTVKPRITPGKSVPASDFTSTDSVVAGPGTSPMEGVPPIAIPDAITRRMHQLEAQTETLLMQGPIDDSPPKYTSV
ncbi:hypothetical protein B0H14DRAFT_2609552 [Mycena olivaceomarginata]|nr:hypothetical protein B0H14DRAFT_2609552 [Mycena olivaceomarginata]